MRVRVHLSSTLKANKMKDKLLQLKKIAQRKVAGSKSVAGSFTLQNGFKLHQCQVATTVKFIVDPMSEEKLVDLYMDTWMKDHKDEKKLVII